jgi:hypothetical protein
MSKLIECPLCGAPLAPSNYEEFPKAWSVKLGGDCRCLYCLGFFDKQQASRLEFEGWDTNTDE